MTPAEKNKAGAKELHNDFLACTKKPVVECHSPPATPPRPPATPSPQAPIATPSPQAPINSCTTDVCGCSCVVSATANSVLDCGWWAKRIEDDTNQHIFKLDMCPKQIRGVSVGTDCHVLEGAMTPPSSFAKCTGSYEQGKGASKVEIEYAPPSCFAKASTTACLFTSVDSCETVLMADLAPGDLVLGRDGATTVVAVQHKAVDTIATLLTFHTADGSSVSVTADHALFVGGDGSTLVAAAEVKVGDVLSVGAVKRVTVSTGAVINAVTADGTIAASDGSALILAASNPIWIAPLIIVSPVVRALINTALFAVGDVDSVGAGASATLTVLAALVAKAAAATATAILAALAVRSCKASA